MGIARNLVSLAYINPEDGDGFENTIAGIVGGAVEVTHYDECDTCWFEEKRGPLVMTLQVAKEVIEEWEGIFGIELMMIPPAFLIQEPEDIEDIDQEWFEEEINKWL